jgi:hypothetical protein
MYSVLPGNDDDDPTIGGAERKMTFDIKKTLLMSAADLDSIYSFLDFI